MAACSPSSVSQIDLNQIKDAVQDLCVTSPSEPTVDLADISNISEALTPDLSDMVSTNDMGQSSMFANYGDDSGDQHCFDTSSVDQRPSSLEREEGSDAQETEQGRVVDLITTASPSREAADGLVGVEVTTENLSDMTLPEVKGTSSDPSSPANIMEDETSKTAPSDS